MSFFDDSRLDDPAALAATDHLLRRLASAGARVRAELEAAEEALAKLESDGFRPRAVLAAGRDARLVRAVLEPVCPVPFVAWPGPGLPGWAGPMDLVIVLGGAAAADSDAVSAAAEAERRGCGLMVACPPDSPVAQASAGSRHAIRLPSQSDDQLAAAVAVLQGLHQMELGPVVDGKAVAAMLDDVAIECSPNNDVASNPAKDLALMLGDALPLVWGGSVLAARAGRRVVEALRLASGRPALAADAGHLLPVLNQPQRDLFADPFDKPEELRPGLVILDDGVDDAGVAEHRRKLEAKAERHDVRVHVVTQANGTDIARYAALTQHGRYAAAYLGIGLGRYGTATDNDPTEPGIPSEDPAW